MSSTTPRAQARTPLPEGTIPVGISLLIAGVATYTFFKVGTVAVGGAEEFAPIAAMWFAVFALAPGFFLPLEQELGRALSHRRAVGDGGQPVVHKVVRLGAILVALVTVVIILFSPIIASSYFDGDWFMVVALIAAFAAYAPAHMTRGISSGTGRFHDYAVVLGADGIVRIILCVALAVVGVTAAGRLRHGSCSVAAFRRRVRRSSRSAADRSGTSRRVERGDPEPRLVAGRLGVCSHTAQRRSDHRKPARLPQ